MSDDQLQPEGKAAASNLVPAAADLGRAGNRFDPSSAAPFVKKSLSEHTRRACRLALAEFFRHSGMKHPSAITPGRSRYKRRHAIDLQ